MVAYYNEFDPGKAAWLRELIRRNIIAPGYVDERSILDVRPADLAGFRQCHFFAGCGVWSYALRLAGWPDDRPVWTGSPPCQPFSAAGKRAGFADARHLAPAWLGLVHERRPERIFGEQVAAAVGEGWLDALQDELEAAGYAVGSLSFPACGVGAPHIRQRLYFGAVRVADAERDGSRSDRSGAIGSAPGGVQGAGGQRQRFWPDAGSGGALLARGLADAECAAGARQRWDGWQGVREQDAVRLARGGLAHRLDLPGNSAGLLSGGDAHGLADADGGIAGDGPLRPGGEHGQQPQDGGAPRGWHSGARSDAAGGLVRPGPTDGPWRDADWLGCRDGKWRPVRPGSFPLAHESAARVVRLRGYGDAIVAEQARWFVETFEEEWGRL